ncbi:Y1388-like protein [Mya arenaria]|uniref:Y1388-like protein n=1 Tax=Mya arenaria TaxID=6604 RepID=A0ABY7FUU5_MYAAR|nr:Y1388-like protein [Mya arenaria]
MYSSSSVFYLGNIRKENDKVYLIHTVEINSVLHSTQWYSSPYSFDKEMLLNLLEEEKKKIRHKLEAFAVLLKEAGIDGTVKSIHAETPGEGVLKAVEEIGASLVVLGCRGMGKLRRTFMGSVSDYVLHHAPVPVLICRHHEDEQHKHHK